jgi:hypothetical protein
MEAAENASQTEWIHLLANMFAKTAKLRMVITCLLFSISNVFLFFCITVLQPQCTANNQCRNSKQIFSEKELRGHGPNLHLHVSVSDLVYIFPGSVNIFPAEELADQSLEYIRGASKIKLKNVNKKRMATARRLIFLEYLKASISDLITLLFSSLQNSEGGGDSDSGDSFAEPLPIFTISKDKNLTFSLFPSLWRPLAKNLQKQKSLLGSM